ncbi:MAG: Gfo/Idh/MocA family protein [Bacilli bacterium]
MTGALGFAVVGCGVVGKMHAEQVQAIENARLVAVVDEVAERAQAFSERYGVPGYTDLSAMLARDDVQVVTVATPSGLHSDVTIRAARAGKHVIVEKPIEVSLTQADAMIRACREHGVKLTVISQHRFDASTVAVKQRIDNGDFGRMMLGEAAVNWYRSQVYYDSGAWRGTWALDGGGALMNQSIHTIDLLQYLMGPVDSVFAHTRTLHHERIEVEDMAVAVVQFKGGGIGTIVGTTAAYPGLSARVEVFGSKGTAVIDKDRLTHLYLRTETPTEGASHGGKRASNLAEQAQAEATGAVSDPAAIAGGAHRAQFLDMIQAIQTDREPMVSGEEGRKPLAIILAIYESARTGRLVRLP